MLKSGRTMPNKDDIPALARWLNESASDLIQDVMARHTGNLLDAMRELVKERDSARAEFREKEAMVNLLYGQIKNMEQDYAKLLKNYDEIRKKYLAATGKPDLYPYGQQ
jgi:predicted nuclease with TOPRIM domain